MTTCFTSASAAETAIREMGGVPSVTHYAAGHIDLVTRDEYFLVKVLTAPVVGKGRPVRSERFVYTASGKKRTSRELCGRVFKKFANDRAAFVAAAIALGVKAATARAMFSHYTVGRYHAA